MDTLKKARLIILVILFISCVKDEDYSIPNNLDVIENRNLAYLIDPENGFQEKTIQQVKEMFVDGEVHQITSDIYIKGYVVSSDESGNFYKELYLQDNPTNPNTGIKIALNRSDIFGKYNLGREVFINLKELYVGELHSGNGIIAIGWAADYRSEELIEIPDNRANIQVLRSSATMPITALPINILQLNSNYIGMFVSIDNAQFQYDLAGEASYVHPLDDFDTSLVIESCEGFGNSSFILETSKFANFKDVTLPSGSGIISGIITRNYQGDKLVMVLNDFTDVRMNGNRCTPLNENDFTTIFSEGFQGMSNNTSISGNGWTNFAEKGFNYWKVSTSSDEGNLESKIAKIGANNSNDLENVAWLISPLIDLEFQNEEFLRFQSSNSFSDNSILELLISLEWDGSQETITSVNWIPLPGIIVDDSENHENWVSSGAIPLSSYSGVAHIAFRYSGGDDDRNQTGTYEIDNFIILTR